MSNTIKDTLVELLRDAKAELKSVERERDEVKRKHRAEHDLANEAIATWKKTKEERDSLQEQLDAAIMLGKMQERRHERELSEARNESFQVQAWKKLIEQERNKMRGL